MKRPMIVALAVIAVAGGAVGCAGSAGSGVDHADYVKANEHLFQELPVFPRTRLRREVSTAYREDEDSPVVGYSTRFDLKLPAGAQAKMVASFFRRKLQAQWRLVERLDGPVLNFRNGRSFTSINLESWRAHVLEIGVDHAYYGKLGR